MADLSIDIQVTGASSAAGDLEEVGSAAESAGKKASGAASGFKAIGTAVAGIGLVTSGIFGLVDAQDDLARSDNTASRARRRASEATEKRVKAEKALSDALSGTGQQMELQIPAGKEFVQMWGDTAVQVRNTNGELSVIPAKYKQVGGATKSITQLQDEYNDAVENERIQLERASLATKENAKQHQRMGIEYAKNIGQVAAGAGMFLPWIESAKNMVKESTPMTQSLAKVAGAAGLVGLAVGGAVVASEELAAIRMADPKFAEQVKKDTKALETMSLTSAALPQVSKAFEDIGKSLDNIPAFKTIRLAVEDFISDPVGTIADLLDNIPGFKTVALAVHDFITNPLGPIIDLLDQIPGFKQVRLAVQDFLSDPLGKITGLLDKIPGFKQIRLAVQDFISDPLGTITNLLDKIPGFKQIRLAVQDFLSNPLGTITSLLDKIPGFKEVRLAVQDFLSDPLGKIVSALDTIPGFKEVRLAVQDFLSDPLGKITAALDTIPGFKEVRLAVQDFISNPLGTIISALDTIPGFKEVRIALQDAVSSAIGTITNALEQIPGFKEVRITLQDLATNPIGTIQAAIDRIPILKSIQIGAIDAASSVVTTVQNAIDGLPERKDVTISANSSTAVTAIMEIGRALGLIPPEKKTTVTADTQAAQQNIGAVTSSLSGIPQTKSFTVNAETARAEGNLSTVQQAIDQLRDKTVTVTVKVSGQGFAGASGSGAGSIGFRHGGTMMVSRPTNVRVGEGFHPEMVSVTPLGKGGIGTMGSTLHPHAAIGGNFISQGSGGLGQAVANIMMNAVSSIAKNVKQETERSENQRYQTLMIQYNNRIVSLQSEIRSAADEVANAQKTLAVAMGNPTKTASAIAAQQRAVTDAQQKYAEATRKLTTLMANKPTKPNVTVEVQAAAKGFGPAVVRKPTLFMAGEKGPEYMNVQPLGRGTRGGGGGGDGSSGDISRLIGLFERFLHSHRGGLQANLMVDGQRMASVSQKYIGTKSYGDR